MEHRLSRPFFFLFFFSLFVPGEAGHLLLVFFTSILRENGQSGAPFTGILHKNGQSRAPFTSILHENGQSRTPFTSMRHENKPGTFY